MNIVRQATENRRPKAEGKTWVHLPHVSLLLIVAGMLLLLTGCPPRGQLPPIMLPGQELAGISTETVSQVIAQRTQQFQTLSGIGKVRIETWQEKYKFSEVFVLGTPGKFRLETLGFLDQPVIFLTSDEMMLSLYSKKQNEYYRGVASQENLFKLSGINLAVEDVIQVFSGNPPLLTTINAEWGMYLPELQTYFLERVSLQENVVQRIWFSPAQQTISNIQEYMLTNGLLTLDIAFKNYRAEAGSYPIPASIRIDRPLDRTRVEVTYTFFEVNQPLDPTVFQFPPPESAKKIHYLDDMTAEQLEHLAPYEEFREEEE